MQTNHHEIISTFISGNEENNGVPAEFSGNFLQIPQEILENKEISTTDKIVYVGIMNYSGCSKEEIAKKLNICRASLFKSLRFLEKHGYVMTCLDENHQKTLKLFSMPRVVEVNKKTENSPSKRVSPSIMKDNMENIELPTPLENADSQEPILINYITNMFKKQVPKSNFSATALKILIKNLDKPKEWYEELFKATEEQISYLTGTNRNKWVMSLNWLLQEANAQRVLERQFVNR